MSFARRIARKEQQDARIAANLPKSRGKLLKQLRRKGTSHAKNPYLERAIEAWAELNSRSKGEQT